MGLKKSSEVYKDMSKELFTEFFESETGLEAFHPEIREALGRHYENKPHGKSDEWQNILQEMPLFDSTHFRFDLDCVSVELPSNQSIDARVFESQLKIFKPWRKGPWRLLGQQIETEWHSDWKWKRIQPHITSLHNRRVLDIGTGNGYFLYRMLGDGAELALGIDPTRLFLYQFAITQRLLPNNNAYLLPLRSEHLPAFESFDTVFSLGVLYHRRSPIDHLTELMSFMRPGGELVLETLIVPGDESTILVPQDRYAKMANVWFLPSAPALENLLQRAGLKNVRTVSANRTSIDEQRSTGWMDFQSLVNFLDVENPTQTVEGYPAPCRAVVIGNKPG